MIKVLYNVHKHALLAEKYHKYLEVISFSIGAGACANLTRKNLVPKMTQETSVFRFLPGEANNDSDERDYLFLIIQDIVRLLLCVDNFCFTGEFS